MEHFFNVYKTLEGKETVVESAQDRDVAVAVIREGIERYIDTFCR